MRKGGHMLYNLSFLNLYHSNVFEQFLQAKIQRINRFSKNVENLEFAVSKDKKLFHFSVKAKRNGKFFYKKVKGMNLYKLSMSALKALRQWLLKA